MGCNVIEYDHLNIYFEKCTVISVLANWDWIWNTTVIHPVSHWCDAVQSILWMYCFFWYNLFRYCIG